jgi:hypothetical protein
VVRNIDAPEAKFGISFGAADREGYEISMFRYLSVAQEAELK